MESNNATQTTATTTTTTTTIKGVVLCNIKKHTTQTQENGQEKRFLHVLTTSIREMRQKTFLPLIMHVRVTLQDFRKSGVLCQKLHENERIRGFRAFSISGIPEISGTLTSM